MLINGKPTLGRVIFAHGAGAGMSSPFMEEMANSLAKIGLEVVRFNFPYMEKSQNDGRRRPPDRMPIILEAFQSVIDQYAGSEVPLYLAGKSMGGRAASMLIEDSSAAACFVFGYPFHPRGKPERIRTEHLVDNSKPVVIFQGDRDPMGSILEVNGYNLANSVRLYWLNDGDHDLKPRKSSGFTYEAHKASVIHAIKGYID